MTTTLKTCFKCLEILPMIEFYKHNMMADGHLNKCKKCAKKDVTKHRNENIDAARAYDKFRANTPSRVAARASYIKTEAGKESHNKAVKRWAKLHPGRKQASAIIGNAIRKGSLIPWPICAIPECINKPQAHHPDYSQPLDVVWLCPKHHKQAHIPF